MGLFVTHRTTESLSSEPSASDENLWIECQQGNNSAFEKIYNDQVEALFDYGCRITDDRLLVEDCIHDLFITLWKKKEDLDITNSIKYYLIRSLRRSIVKSLQKRRKLGTIPFETYFDLSSNTSDVEDTHRLKSLREQISKLPKRQKEAIDLRFYHNLDYQEISSVLEVSVDAAYNLVYKAVKSLKRTIVGK